MTDKMTETSPTDTVNRLKRNECGAFGIRIAADGTWYYQGSPIGRKELVKLFSTVLSRDADGIYWLTTPAEHGTIEVDDVPFVAVEATIDGEGRNQVIRLRTNLDIWVDVGADHPLRVEHNHETGEPSPYVMVRDGLEARLARTVYYDLVAHAVDGNGAVAPLDTKSDAEQVIGLWSKGSFFPLGTVATEDMP